MFSLLILILLLVVLLLIVDRVYSNYIINKLGINELISCISSHPERNHDFIPNCSTHNCWGGSTYPVFTNNLGRRDQMIRDIPLSISIPRIVIVGDSFTEGPQNWEYTFIAKTAKKLPQYDFINAGVRGYGPSTYYLLVKDLLIDKGLKFDEVIVFIDVGDIHNEATYYKDNDDGSLTTSIEPRDHIYSHYGAVREAIRSKWFGTNKLVTAIERILIKVGFYSLPTKNRGDVFDDPMSAWTYKTETELAYYAPRGYLPLGVQGGINKAINKMNLLYNLLQEHSIPLSVAVYPWPAQLLHNEVNSRQVIVWQEWSQFVGCKRFINLFPDFFAEKNKFNKLFPGGWYEKLFIFGDIHYNEHGNEIISRHLEKELTTTPVEKYRT